MLSRVISPPLLNDEQMYTPRVFLTARCLAIGKQKSAIVINCEVREKHRLRSDSLGRTFARRTKASLRRLRDLWQCPDMRKVYAWSVSAYPSGKQASKSSKNLNYSTHHRS